MPRKFLKKYMPDPHKIKQHKLLSIFGDLLHDANLWHMNRRSVAGAFMVGLFFAWWPVPFQMVLAAAGAIMLRTNLPLSVSLVWITNPITIGPMFYFAYVVGTWVLGVPEKDFSIEPTLTWLMNEMLLVWKPLVTGSLLLAIFSAALGYFTMNTIWVMAVRNRQQRRRERRRENRALEGRVDRRKS